jgi:GntR family transcriptional regulator
LLERSGLTAERATQTISATLASPEVADALQLDLGSPLIALTRVVYDRSDRGVEHLHALYRPDRYSFQFDLVRTGSTGRRRWPPPSARYGRSLPTWWRVATRRLPRRQNSWRSASAS